MTLFEYVNARRGRAAALARRLGVQPCSVSNWARSGRRIPLEYCFAIERLSHGAVKASELRPDVDFRTSPVKRDTL